MRVVLDTNVILRASQPMHTHAKPAFESMKRLTDARHELCIVPQVLYEFWVVATRPATENGLGLPVAQADAEVSRLLGLLTFLDDAKDLFRRWRALVTERQVQGKAAHDARIVAAMSLHGVDTILTFNRADFERYPGIVVMSPLDAVQGA
ncbi:MAG: type II toxin-antitoxin system VapC family toxin [Planctomycetota bacterium]